MDTFPIEAYLGTVYVTREGTVIKCYSYYGTNDEYINFGQFGVEKIIDIEVLKVDPADRLFLKFREIRLTSTEEFLDMLQSYINRGYRVISFNDFKKEK